jgi:hypothetical protein
LGQALRRSAAYFHSAVARPSPAYYTQISERRLVPLRMAQEVDAGDFIVLAKTS